MSGLTALLFGTKKSLASPLGKALANYLKAEDIIIHVVENPAAIKGKGPYSYAFLVAEEMVPPPPLNVWFEVFAGEKRPSPRLFLLSKNELPSAWQENLPFESTLDEQNYKVVLSEILHPGQSIRGLGDSVVVDMSAGGESAHFDMGITDQVLSTEADESSAEEKSGFYSGGDVESRLSLEEQQGEPSLGTPRKSPTPPPPGRPNAFNQMGGLSLKLKTAVGPQNPEAATQFAPLAEKGSLPLAPSKEIPSLQLGGAEAQNEDLAESIQADVEESRERFMGNEAAADAGGEDAAPFNLDEDTSAIDKEAPGQVSGEEFGFEPRGNATHVSAVSQNPDSEAVEESQISSPALELSDFSSPAPTEDDGQRAANLTSSIQLEQLVHPEGTRLNEPLAGRAHYVEGASATEDPATSSENDEDEFSEQSAVAHAPQSAAGKSKDLRTLEQYAAMKDREVRERESTIKILKSQIQKNEAKLGKSEESRRQLMLKFDEAQTEIRALKEEIDQKNFSIQKIEDKHREELKAVQVRMDGAQFEASKSNKRLEDFRNRVRQDIMKIRAQERELANKLEIQKRDADALLAAKDEKLLSQRREIDQLQFELDNLKERLIEETEKAEERSGRLKRALKSLKLAEDMLSGIKEEVLPSSSDDSGDDEGEAA